MGFSQDIYLESLRSFGLRLVLSLAYQLATEVKMDTSGGMAFTIRFFRRK